VVFGPDRMFCPEPIELAFATADGLAGVRMTRTRNRRRPAFKCGAATSGKNWRRGQLSYKAGLLRQSSFKVLTKRN
jgi:hypothetical protein